MQWIKQENHWVGDEKVTVIPKKISTTKEKPLVLHWAYRKCILRVTKLYELEVLSCEDPNTYEGREPELKELSAPPGQLPGKCFPWISSQKLTAVVQGIRPHLQLLAELDMVSQMNRILEFCFTISESNISQTIYGHIRAPERQTIVGNSEGNAEVETPGN